MIQTSGKLMVYKIVSKWEIVGQESNHLVTANGLCKGHELLLLVGFIGNGIGNNLKEWETLARVLVLCEQQWQQVQDVEEHFGLGFGHVVTLKMENNKWLLGE